MCTISGNIAPIVLHQCKPGVSTLRSKVVSSADGVTKNMTGISEDLATVLSAAGSEAFREVNADKSVVTGYPPVSR
jgi:hypothetical protein